MTRYLKTSKNCWLRTDRIVAIVADGALDIHHASNDETVQVLYEPCDKNQNPRTTTTTLGDLRAAGELPFLPS